MKKTKTTLELTMIDWNLSML